MTPAKIALLPDRGVVSVRGPDAGTLLQGIVTNDLDLLADQATIHAALLTPQGKILFEFFIARSDDGYLLETAAAQVPGLIKRLGMYRLRAKVDIADASAEYRVLALWGSAAANPGETNRTVSFTDPRLPALGTRIMAEARFAADIASASNGEDASAADYDAHRIALGVPESGKDYPLGDTFPHEADFDLLHGVSFTKGCFIGQEVVSRMQHRATVRKRVAPIEAVGSAALQSGTDITIGDAGIGKIGSVAGHQGVALLRLDRATEAKAKGLPMLAGGAEIRLRKVDWASFDLAPEPAAETS